MSSGVKDYHHLIQLVGVEEGVDLLLNDEGKLIGFEPDRRFGQDVLVGDFYVVGTDGENLASLPQDKMEKYAALSRAGQMRGARQRAQLPLFLPGRVFFCLVIFVVLIAVIAGWNGVKDFKTASFETYLFLVVVNWFDGFVIDLLWVGHSKIWRIEGMEGAPYGKPWRTVYTKRSAATALYLLVAAAVGGIVVLIGKI